LEIIHHPPTFPQLPEAFKNLYDEYFSQWGHLVLEYAKPVAEDEPNFGKSNPWADWGQHQNLIQRKRVSELDKFLEVETVPKPKYIGNLGYVQIKYIRTICL
jgi:hypothetical protein